MALNVVLYEPEIPAKYQEILVVPVWQQVQDSI